MVSRAWRRSVARRYRSADPCAASLSPPLPAASTLRERLASYSPPAMPSAKITSSRTQSASSPLWPKTARRFRLQPAQHAVGEDLVFAVRRAQVRCSGRRSTWRWPSGSPSSRLRRWDACERAALSARTAMRRVAPAVRPRVSDDFEGRSMTPRRRRRRSNATAARETLRSRRRSSQCRRGTRHAPAANPAPRSRPRRRPRAGRRQSAAAASAEKGCRSIRR